MRPFRSLTVASAVGILATSFALAAPAAQASPPAPLEQGPAFSTTALCGFSTTLDVADARERIVKTSTAADGTVTQRYTGHLVQVITNDVTGKTLKVLASGPATLVTSPDGAVTFDGQGLSVLFAGPRSRAATGLTTGLLLVKGHLSYTVTDNALATLSIQGTTTDLCKAIA